MAYDQSISNRNIAGFFIQKIYRHMEHGSFYLGPGTAFGTAAADPKNLCFRAGGLYRLHHVPQGIRRALEHRAD